MTTDVIIENGGDIFLRSLKKCRIGLLSGDTSVDSHLRIVTPACPDGYGVCISSGTMGHSLSFGKADTVPITSLFAILADAVATACCNRVYSELDIPTALEFAGSCSGVDGALIVIGEKIGVWGKIELERV